MNVDIRLQKVDLYKSKADEFIIEGNTLIPPFNAIPGLGTNVAIQIVEARKDGEFLSKEDLQQRGRVSKTIIEYMDATWLFRRNARCQSAYPCSRSIEFARLNIELYVYYDKCNNVVIVLCTKEWDFPLFSVVYI